MEMRQLSRIIDNLTSAIREMEENAGNAVEALKATEVRDEFLGELESEIRDGIQALYEAGEDYEKVVTGLVADVRQVDEELSRATGESRRRSRKRRR